LIFANLRVLCGLRAFISAVRASPRQTASHATPAAEQIAVAPAQRSAVVLAPVDAPEAPAAEMAARIGAPAAGSAANTIVAADLTAAKAARVAEFPAAPVGGSVANTTAVADQTAAKAAPARHSSGFPVDGLSAHGLRRNARTRVHERHPRAAPRFLVREWVRD